jgi:ABC-2 type transport system permease protein
VIKPFPDTQAVQDATPPQPRTIGAVNWLGLWTLYMKEVRRFLEGLPPNGAGSGRAEPAVHDGVFPGHGGHEPTAGLGAPFTSFLAPGLVMLGLLNNAFANSSSSLISAKMMGNHVDWMMPPLSPSELAAAFIGGAVTRGDCLWRSPRPSPSRPSPICRSPILWAVIYFGLSAALMMGMIGVIAGLWAEKFDHLALITKVVITPLAFLSGTFYSVEILPEPFYTISHINPVFFLIDGFRYGFIGAGDSNLLVGALVCLAINIALLIACLSDIALRLALEELSASA